MRNKMIKNYKNNTMFGSILMIGIMVLLVGFSYAFFVYNKTGLYTHTITGGKMSIIYNETTGNNITINNAYPLSNEEALTKGLEFEFTITGYNESDKNIYYAIEMDYGEDLSNKERFIDNNLKLSLYENEEEVFENEIFDNLDNQDIYYGYIKSGTSVDSPVTNNYKLRIWINDYVVISDTLSSDLSTWNDFEWDWLEEYNKSVYNELMNSDSQNLSDYGISIYTSEEFQNMYANFKVNVTADLTYDDVDFITYDANGGEFTPEKTSLTTGEITLRKPVMDGKGFLGWSSNPNASEPEYLAGDYYSGDGRILYAVYSDTRNVMNYFSTAITSQKSYIKEVYFINDTQSNIDARYNAASIKADLTYNNKGKVLGWLEEDYVEEETNTQYYKLYVGSEGTTYLNTGYTLFQSWVNVEKINFDNVDTSQVETFVYMFNNCNSLINLELYNFNTKQVKFMSHMFENCKSLISLDFRYFNTSKVTDMNSMFRDCHKLYSLNISNFNTSNVTDMSGMFRNISIQYLNLSNFDTNNVTDMSKMFSGCNYLEKLNVSNFDTSNVKSMVEIFYGCSGLTTLDVSNFNTSEVTSMYGMFSNCRSLLTLDLSNFDTSEVRNMSQMFDSCESLPSVGYDSDYDLYLGVFDTSNVTNMSRMFQGCINLKKIDLSNFDTSKVTDMSSMFSDCESIKTVGPGEEYDLNLGGWDTNNVTTMYWMFGRSRTNVSLNFTIIDLSEFDILSLKNTSMMFIGCYVLTTIYCNTDWNTGIVTSSSDMFGSCFKLVGAVPHDSTKTDITMANPDTGYFTRKNV